MYTCTIISNYLDGILGLASLDSATTGVAPPKFADDVTLALGTTPESHDSTYTNFDANSMEKC